MADLSIVRLPVGPMDNNVYVLIDPTTRESIVVEAANDANRILGAVEGTTVRYILQTHGHSDHVQALAEVKQVTGAPVAIHPADAAMLPVSADLALADGDVLHLGGHEIRVIHTPPRRRGNSWRLACRTFGTRIYA